MLIYFSKLINTVLAKMFTDEFYSLTVINLSSQMRHPLLRVDHNSQSIQQLS